VGAAAGSWGVPDLQADADAEILSNSAIHKACMERNLPEIKTLLASSPELLEQRDAFNMTPFMTAALCGDLEMVRIPYPQAKRCGEGNIDNLVAWP
jgi:ankyrin repeat protein